MKNLIVVSDPPTKLQTEIQDIPVPSYNDNQILIKVVVAGANPKDWKHPGPLYFNSKLNQGDDAGGLVHAFGKNVTGFSIGDRVAAFHQMNTPNGTYAEFTVAEKQTVFHIPDSLSFEEAATIPLTAYTAAVGLYRILELPSPWDNTPASIPLIVNSASSAVGAFAVKLARLNPAITPIIGIAGASADFAKSVGCDIVLDYRSSTIVEDLASALDSRKCSHVFDASNTLASAKYLSSVLEKGVGKYTCTTGIEDDQREYLKDVGVAKQIWCGCVHEDKDFGAKDFGAVWAGMFGRLLADGRLTGQPYEIVPGGLEGVESALKTLMNRKEGNTKFVFRIADTPGLK